MVVSGRMRDSRAERSVSAGRTFCNVHAPRCVVCTSRSAETDADAFGSNAAAAVIAPSETPRPTSRTRSRFRPLFRRPSTVPRLNPGIFHSKDRSLSRVFPSLILLQLLHLIEPHPTHLQGDGAGVLGACQGQLHRDHIVQHPSPGVWFKQHSVQFTHHVIKRLC